MTSAKRSVKTLLQLILIYSIHLGCEQTVKQVACVGDSITFGARLEAPETYSYPAQLQLLLGDKYQVHNMGVGSCTLIRKGKPTVWAQLSKIRALKPDIVVISLGTNDTCGLGTCGNRKCWEYKDEYKQDYLDLIDSLNTSASAPRIWVCAPSPMVLETPGLGLERQEGLGIRKPRLKEILGWVREVAEEKGVNFIDLNTPLDHRPELFTEKDGVHPNQDGYKAIADLVYQSISQ